MKKAAPPKFNVFKQKAFLRDAINMLRNISIPETLGVAQRLEGRVFQGLQTRVRVAEGCHQL